MYRHFAPCFTDTILTGMHFTGFVYGCYSSQAINLLNSLHRQKRAAITVFSMGYVLFFRLTNIDRTAVFIRNFKLTKISSVFSLLKKNFMILGSLVPVASLVNKLLTGILT
jgi:hypothetical protein